MKLKIDTFNKTIQLEQSAKLTELFSLVKKLFPNDEWKQYSIEVVQYIYNWYNPIYIPAAWTPQFIHNFEITNGNTETYCIESN